MWIAIGLAILVAFGALVIWSRIDSAKIGKEKADKTYAQRFVWIDDKGNARELTDDQKDHLNTEYLGTDGARPHIKWRYGSRTYNGRIGGYYLLRRSLPRGMPIRKL